jgi:N-acyl homoserine lactone hydrolase
LGLLASGRTAAEAGEVQDDEDQPDDAGGDPDPRDDEQEDDPEDDERECGTDHDFRVPGAEGGKPVIHAHLAGHVAAYGGIHPVWVHTIDHPDGRILVDTGMPDTGVLPDVDVVVNTHLHVDHCGGNHQYPGVPVHVQREALAAEPDEHTRLEWIHVPGVTYVEHDGEVEILPGITLVPTPGHCAGHQSVVVEGVGVVGGDVAYSFRELGTGATEGQRRVLELAAPTWLAHVERPHVPRRNP